jgi:hypothetical protein
MDDAHTIERLENLARKEGMTVDAYREYVYDRSDALWCDLITARKKAKRHNQIKVA